MKILAVDTGEKRIGLATCDRMEIAATPLTVIKAGKDAAKRIIEIAEQEGAQLIVIGLATSFDGVEREPCERARKLGNQIAQNTNATVDYYDERLTSKIAQASLIEGGMKREKRKQHVDAVAASIMLQGYMDHRRVQNISAL